VLFWYLDIFALKFWLDLDIGVNGVTQENLLIFSFKIDFFSQIDYRDIQYSITVLKKTIKTILKLLRFLFIDIKRYSSFNRYKLPVWGQSDQVTSRDDRDEIWQLRLFWLDISVAGHDKHFQ